MAYNVQSQMVLMVRLDEPFRVTKKFEYYAQQTLKAGAVLKCKG